MGNVIYKDRKHTSCSKWDGVKETFGKEGLLPFWVADMDFEVPKCVQDGLKEYIEQGTFGYYLPEEGYLKAFINWEETHHGYHVEAEWVRFAPGVVPAINWLIQMLTEEKDSILIMQPVYYPFRNGIENNRREVVDCPLLLQDGKYKIDFERFEKKIIEHQVKMFIFCSPHNPVGRVWSFEEIRKVMEICKKHHVYVLSDEIHQDLVIGNHKQIPTATVGDYQDILISMTAASKTFNLASCQNSFVIIQSEELRNRFDTYVNQIRIQGGNAFGYIAVQKAYEGGNEWLKELLEILEDNYHYVKNTLEKELPKVWISELEGTYLMWIDLGDYIKGDEIESFMIEECGLGVDFGSWFGGEKYESFIRFNLATSKENVQTAVERIVQNIKNK